MRTRAHDPKRARARQRTWLSATLLCAATWVAAGCGDDGPKRQRTDSGVDAAPGASCDPVGRSVACTGKGGCAGSQVCEDDNTYGACTCGAVPASDGGVAASDGAVAVGDAGGSAQVGDGGVPTSLACGAACTKNADCGGTASCVTTRKGTRTVEGLGPLPVELFPGGMCSQVPLAPADSAQACDPTAVGPAQGCGSCAVCVPEFFSDGVATVCREKCVPSATDNACTRDEYTCAFGLGACVEGCTKDDECRIYTKDTDADGEADAEFYDAMSTARCNMATRRCQVTGKAAAQAGDPCLRDDDCEADGFCLTEGSGNFITPFKGGYCVKDGCRVAGLGCAGTGTCTDTRAWDPFEGLGTMCVRGCEQGKETAAEQLGAAGHGAGCRPGYMCRWNGENDAKGSCMPGNYNAVAASNLGTVCKADSDCFSPFGHGVCATMGSEAANVTFCTLFDCGAPGLPRDMCGANSQCVGVDEELGLTACLRTCTDATTCTAGLACVPLQNMMKVCAFGCTANNQCRTGETCARTGACVPN